MSFVKRFSIGIVLILFCCALIWAQSGKTEQANSMQTAKVVQDSNHPDPNSGTTDPNK